MEYCAARAGVMHAVHHGRTVSAHVAAVRLRGRGVVTAWLGAGRCMVFNGLVSDAVFALRDSPLVYQCSG